MLLNYLRIFLRQFSRNRTFTAINLLGLATGLACFVLIRLYVINETSYDRHYSDADNIYRLAMKGEMSGFSFESAVIGGPFGKILREDIPEVIHSTTFYKLPRSALLKKDENHFYEDNIIYPGRADRYLPAPPQIRTSDFLASGSSADRFAKMEQKSGEYGA